jgi:hypothetical protein
MRNRHSLFQVICFLIGLLFWEWTAYGIPQKETNKEFKHQSLVRKDLLSKKIVKLKPPERNIFKPDKRRKPSVMAGDIGSILGIPKEELPTEKTDKKKAASDSTSLRYIGYVGSMEKTVALVIFEGLALAVKKGDMVSDSFEVLNITRKEIEFAGRDSITRKVSLEGEEL